MNSEKEHLRRQALRQLQLEQLTERNVELNRDLEALLSSNRNKRNYVLLAGKKLQKTIKKSPPCVMHKS